MDGKLEVIHKSLKRETGYISIGRSKRDPLKRNANQLEHALWLNLHANILKKS